MVYNTTLPMTAIRKRPCSPTECIDVEWENKFTRSPPRRTSINLPYSHYALIYLDNVGNLHVAESPSIQDNKATIFTAEVCNSFLESIGANTRYHKPHSARPAAHGSDHSKDTYHHRHEKGRRLRTPRPLPVTLSPRSETQSPLSSSLSGAAVYRISLKISDYDGLERYYTTSFTWLQQVNCRTIAKAFIKFIEPQKQVRHPYNGGRPEPGAPPGTKGDPEKTKPGWWPAGIVHREPDHLKREERVGLLVHIVRRLGRIGVTADELLDIAFDYKRQLKDQERFPILEEIFKVRKIEEKYERGEVNALSLVYVTDYEAYLKAARDSDSVTGPEEVQAPSTAISDDMPVPCTMPTMLEERYQHSHLPETFSFGYPARQDRPLNMSCNDYSGDYSATLITPPTTEKLVTPNEQAPFEHQAWAPFREASTAGPAAVPIQHSSSQYNRWPPSFSQNQFGPLGYGFPVSHAMPDTCTQ